MIQKMSVNMKLQFDLDGKMHNFRSKVFRKDMKWIQDLLEFS